MIYNILLVILVIDAVVLVAAILLQSGKGSGLAANFGGASSSPDAFIGIRQAGTLLTSATWWCAGIFLALAFVLQILSTRQQVPKSVLEDTFGTPAATPVAPITQPPTTTAPSPLPLTAAPGTETTSPATTPATVPPVGQPKK